ncbi:MAG: hypothetical protein HY854_10540 [Burkholderiales bacterium]|nr:hypothetical protein [Burkholderiales bacterium]
MKAALLLIACCALAAGTASAACPQPVDMRHDHMLGMWEARIGGGNDATLHLQRHPEYPGSFTGTVERKGQRARVAGDIIKGEFTLEESVDGVKISAHWIGDVVDGSCGREVRGTWQGEGDQAPIVPFVLRRR